MLRGGTRGPNYDEASVRTCEKELANIGLTPNIMIDCSHANSNKDHNKQPGVARDIIRQILEGNQSIIGLMI